MEISQAWPKKKDIKKGDQETLKTLEKLENPRKHFFNVHFGCFVRRYELIGKYDGAVYDPQIAGKIEERISVSSDYSDYDWFEVWGLACCRTIEEGY